MALGTRGCARSWCRGEPQVSGLCRLCELEMAHAARQHKRTLGVGELKEWTLEQLKAVRRLDRALEAARKAERRAAAAMAAARALLPVEPYDVRPANYDPDDSSAPEPGLETDDAPQAMRPQRDASDRGDL